MPHCIVLLASVLLFCTTGISQDSTRRYQLPDSVKAVSFITDINIKSITGKKEVYAGIKTSEVSLAMQSDGKTREIEFEFPETAVVLASGIGVQKDDGELEWNYNWQLNTNYKLLIASASDSAGNYTIYSGYILLPENNKWKLIGSCQVNGNATTLQSLQTFRSIDKKRSIQADFTNVFAQRSGGSWKRLDNATSPPPVINPMPNTDSVQQYAIDRSIIQQAIATGKTDVSKDTAGVFYKIVNAGTGNPVNLTDTVTVHYKLRIFNTDSVLQQTDKPATFPLNRLIAGWQLVVPLVKANGGKVKLVIPSGLAYSIRTRSAQIPPNSILEFEVEVLDAKPATK
jgi:FKBP-type peptidyl-prolyl cis-trans isomerase FkpA